MKKMMSVILSAVFFAMGTQSIASTNNKETLSCKMLRMEGMKNDGRFFTSQEIKVSNGRVDVASIATDGDTHWVESANVVSRGDMHDLKVLFRVDSQDLHVAVVYNCRSIVTANSKDAGPARFRCGNVGGNEEWIINVDLEKQKASFFDNDAYVLVDLVGIEGLESTNATVNYLFEGKDTNSAPGDRLRITFSVAPFSSHAPKASLTLEFGKPSQYSFDASTCIEDNSIDL